MESLDQKTLGRIKRDPWAMEILDTIYGHRLTGFTSSHTVYALLRLIRKYPEFEPSYSFLEEIGVIKMVPKMMPEAVELSEGIEKQIAGLLWVTDQQFSAYQARKAAMPQSGIPSEISPTLTSLPTSTPPDYTTFTTDGTDPSIPTWTSVPTSTPPYTHTETLTPTSIALMYKNQNPENINRTPKNLEYSIREDPIREDPIYLISKNKFKEDLI